MASVTLDEVVPLLRLPGPNLVKLDADGAEAHILRGGRDTLSSQECRSVLAEIEEEQADAAVSLLESYGFRLDGRHKRKKSSTIWYGIFRRVT